MTALTYGTYIKTMQDMLVIPADNVDAAFRNIIPSMINYAELRILRELDFLTTVSSTTGLLSANSRNLTMPTATVVCNSINVITPVTAVTADTGTRNPLYRVGLDFLNAVYPNVSGAGVPKFYALLSDTAVVVGPAADAAYTTEFIVTTRPTPLGPPDTSATFISTYLPDLFVAASMIFGAGYQQNFGSQSDNPQSAMSWEQQYQGLKAGANMEELRKKAQSVSWAPYTPSPEANVSRDRANGG